MERRIIVKPLQRINSIINFIAYSKKDEVSLQDISISTGLHSSTVHRYLKALKTLGYIEQNPITTHYRLGYKLIELGSIAISRIEIRAIAKPEMIELRDFTNETVSLSLRTDKLHRIYVHVEKSREFLRTDLLLSTPIPLYKGASGRVLSAWLSSEEINAIVQDMNKNSDKYPDKMNLTSNFLNDLEFVRTNGYIFIQDEVTSGVSTLSVPIRNSFGKVIAALSIHGPSARFNVQIQKDILPSLLNSARKISQALGYINKN